MSGSTPGSNLVVVASRSNSQQFSRQPSRRGSTHSPRPVTAVHTSTSENFTRGRDLHHSYLNSDTNLTSTDHLLNDWQGYLDSVNEVANLIESGPLLYEWERSVIDPFRPNLGSFEYSTYVTLRRRFKHAAELLQKHLRNGEKEWTSDIIFSGYVVSFVSSLFENTEAEIEECMDPPPSLETLIVKLRLEVSDMDDPTGESHLPDSDSSSWFRRANSYHIIECAKGLESATSDVDLRSRLKSLLDRASEQAPSERYQYQSLYDRMVQLWHVRNPKRAEQQLAVNILEQSIQILGSIIKRQQIPRELLYLWVVRSYFFNLEPNLLRRSS